MTRLFDCSRSLGPPCDTSAIKTLLAVASLLAASCSSVATPSGPAATPPVNPEAVATLAAGRVESLPTGPVYVRFIQFTQPPGYVINSKQHVPSVIYVETGTHQVTLNGQPPVDLAAGEALFHQSVTHVHQNPGQTPSSWYSIAVWPRSARGQPLVDSIARSAFESQDVDPSLLPLTAYSVVLRHVTLSPGQASGAHRFGGIAAFYVLDGSLSIRSGSGTAVVTARQGASFAPGVAIDESAPGSTAAEYLEFIVTPAGAEFEVSVSRL